jgi:hypothetical protein
MSSGPPEHHLPIPLFPLRLQNTSAIRDGQRGPCGALIYFLRFLRFLRNLSLGIVRYLGWPEQANDNHPQSKSSSRLPFSAPLNGITELFDKPLLLWGEKPVCRGSCKSSSESKNRVCTHSFLRQPRKKRNKSKKEPVWRSSTGAWGLPS